MFPLATYSSAVGMPALAASVLTYFPIGAYTSSPNSLVDFFMTDTNIGTNRIRDLYVKYEKEHDPSLVNIEEGKLLFDAIERDQGNFFPLLISKVLNAVDNNGYEGVLLEIDNFITRAALGVSLEDKAKYFSISSMLDLTDHIALEITKQYVANNMDIQTTLFNIFENFVSNMDANYLSNRITFMEPLQLNSGKQIERGSIVTALMSRDSFAYAKFLEIILAQDYFNAYRNNNSLIGSIRDIPDMFDNEIGYIIERLKDSRKFDILLPALFNSQRIKREIRRMTLYTPYVNKRLWNSPKNKSLEGTIFGFLFSSSDRLSCNTEAERIGKILKAIRAIEHCKRSFRADAIKEMKDRQGCNVRHLITRNPECARDIMASINNQLEGDIDWDSMSRNRAEG